MISSKHKMEYSLWCLCGNKQQKRAQNVFGDQITHQICHSALDEQILWLQVISALCTKFVLPYILLSFLLAIHKFRYEL